MSGILPESAFIVTGPVAQLKLSPTRIRSGKNQINLLFLAPLDPTKAQTTVEFVIYAPPANGAIRPTCTEKLVLVIPTPQLPQILLDRKVIDVMAWPESQSITTSIRAKLAGPITAKYAADAQVVLSTSTSKAIVENCPLFKSVPVHLQLPQPHAASYFLNTQQRTQIEIKSALGNGPIQPAQVDVVVTRIAPFLVHLAQALSVTAILAVLVLIWRLFRLLGPPSTNEATVLRAGQLEGKCVLEKGVQKQWQ